MLKRVERLEENREYGMGGEAGRGVEMEGGHGDVERWLEGAKEEWRRGHGGVGRSGRGRRGQGIVERVGGETGRDAGRGREVEGE